MSLKSIVQALGGELYAGGRRANVPAPGHSRHDRSVSLLLQDGRVVVHSFGGADWREVLGDLRRRGLIGTANRVACEPAPAGSSPAPPATSERILAARRLWDAGRPLAGTLSARHLRLRAIGRAPPGPEVLRHHPAAPVAVYAPRSTTRPALLAAIRGPAGLLTAIEITYLDPSGRRALGLKLPRKTIGVVPPGSAVRLDPDGRDLLVGEGVFTTLSASERFGWPGWALLSTRNLRAWSPPAGVTQVIIAADRGLDGEASAARLARRLAAAGVGVDVRLPPARHGDWNEAAGAAQPPRRQEGGQGRARLKGPG